jgi:putative colanic acid biosynthesis acetyltransferase WcaF
MSTPGCEPRRLGAPLRANGLGTFAGAPSFPLRHRLLRLIWSVVWRLLASWTPAPLHRWRIFLINAFGGQVDSSCSVYGTVRIWYPPNLQMARFAALGPGVDCYSMEKIEIGAYAVVSQRTFLCTGTHDTSDPNFQISSHAIRIGAQAWVAAEAFVGPGVTVGEGAVLGARGAAFVDLEPWTIYQGNPATAKRTRARFTRP